MGNYLGRIIELSYALKSESPRPIHEGELSKKFTDEEHLLFASGSDVVWISENPEQSLRGYWEKRRDITGMRIDGTEKRPIRIVTYAQLDKNGIPRITRASLSETGLLIQGESTEWSEQTMEVMRRY